MINNKEIYNYFKNIEPIDVIKEDMVLFNMFSDIKMYALNLVNTDTPYDFNELVNVDILNYVSNALPRIKDKFLYNLLKIDGTYIRKYGFYLGLKMLYYDYMVKPFLLK